MTPSPVVLKGVLLAAASSWHLWLGTRSTWLVELLFGMTPYLVLVFAWDFIGRAWILFSVIALLGWLDVNVGLVVKEAASKSSTAGVAKVIQLVASLGAVGAAALLALVLPSPRKAVVRKRSRRQSERAD
jgi:hypothetical protein